MAARGGGSGGRPTGTDGTDFNFREQIAPRYEISKQAKMIVRFTIYMQFMMMVIVAIQLFTYHFKDQFTQFSNFFPKPHKWEYIWLLSVIPSIFGISSLNRNRLKMIKIYYYGSILFGLLPILITMLFNASELWDYVQNKKTTYFFNGFPEIVLWYIFLFVAIQIHTLSIYYARVLKNTWKDPIKRS